MGSNEGDRLAHLRAALERIESLGLLRDVRASHAYETPPERPGDGGAFLNAAVSGTCACSPRELLQSLLGVEASLGRVRASGAHGGPRVIDLDLVLHGGVVLEEPGLHLPHPRFALRPFVLVPLAEIEPEMLEPRSGRAVHSLLAALKTAPLPRVGSLRK
jgi:2-amino-4-hydroxy-6-hydroxymethyldihydropteridine diphosphokinase